MFFRRSLIILAVVLPSFVLGHSAQAINWSRCHVEQGETTITAGSATTNVALTTTITDLTTAFILAQASGDVGARAATDHRVAATLTGVNQATFTRVGTTDDAQVSYSVIQCYEDEFEVKTGTIALGAGVASNTGALSAAVAEADSIVLVSTTTAAAGSNDATSAVTAALQDASTVVVQRASAAAVAVTAYYQVITFAVSAIDNIQTGEVTLSSGIQSTTSALTSAVDLSRSWVLCSADATNNGLQQTSIACTLSDPNTVTVQRDSAAAYTNRVRYYVVSWPENTVTVQSGSESNDPAAADGARVDHDLTLTGLDDIGRSFPYMTLNVTGTSTEYPRNAWIYYILNTTTLRTSFWRSDAASNSDANYKYWQIVSFPSPYEPTGWGFIINTTGSDPTPTANFGTGLISFSCENLTAFYGTPCKDGSSGSRYDYGVTMERGGCGSACNLSGTAWVGTYENDGSVTTTHPIGIIDFDPAISGTATSAPAIIGDDTATTDENENSAAMWNEVTGELYGWARFRSLQAYESTTLGSTRDNWGWIRLRGASTADGSEYGVRFDTDTETFSGWGWNDNGTDAAGTEIDGSGFGWIKFDLDTSGLTVQDAWLKTSHGDFYSQSGVNVTIDPSTYGDYASTYLILANDLLTNFTATELGTYSETTDLGGIPEDNGSNVFRGDLGSIYVNELILEAQEDSNEQIGDCDDTWLNSETDPLGGEVFYCTGNLTINNNLTFYNASGSDIGSGTIVVGGNLYINDNMNYYNATIDQHINNLASVAFIVLGRVEIDPSVTKLVGAYIILGDSHIALTDPYDFATGDGTSPLELAGLVMARSFNFQRTSIGSVVEPTPAEYIYYDGRIFANTPPGLEDFTSTFPNQ